MENYHKIERPVFVERMIDVLRECVEANNFDNLDEWLTFGEWVLSHPDDSNHGIYDRHAGESRSDPNWSNSRWTMGDFIASCFRKDVNPPVSARGQLANLLHLFCTQFDWRLDQHLTENKSIDASTNTPRCRALEALVGFGLWLRRNDGGSDISEVMAILEKRLAPTAKYPLTPPEYAILGKNYNRLFYLMRRGRLHTNQSYSLGMNFQNGWRHLIVSWDLIRRLSQPMKYCEMTFISRSNIY